MGKRNRGGRPTIFTQELGEEVLKYLRVGMLVQDAAQLAGIHKDSIYTWAAKGMKRGAPAELREFAVALPKARMTAKGRALTSVNLAMSKNWKAAAWFLSVSDPKNYGPKVRVTLDQEFTDALTRIRQKLPVEVYEQVLSAIIEDGSGEGTGEDSPGEADPIH